MQARSFKRSIQALALGLLALWLAAPAAAHADTIGQTFPTGGPCSPEMMWVDPSYAVEMPGTVDSFSFQSRFDWFFGGAEGARLAFKVLRPTGGTGYTVVGSTPLETLQTSDSLETFAPETPISVRRGDILGFWIGEFNLPGCVSFDEGDASAAGAANPRTGDAVDVPLCCYGHLNLSAEFTPSKRAPAPPRPFQLDAASDTGASDADGATADTTPTFTGTAEPGSTVTLYVDGEPRGTAAAATDGGAFEITTDHLSDGSHQVTATATNDAGEGRASAAVSVLVDTVAPSRTIVRPAGTYALNQPVDASYSCDDGPGASGVAACTGDPGVDTASVGGKSFSVTATDVAGNHATTTAHYAVVYVFSGLDSPADAVKAGRTIPIKWHVADYAGAPIAAASSLAGVASSAGTVDTSGYWYSGGGWWQLNWNTQKAYAGQDRTITITLADGVRHSATYAFR